MALIECFTGGNFEKTVKIPRNKRTGTKRTEQNKIAHSPI